MNKKQKILTFVALVVFIVLGALHYVWVASYWDTRDHGYRKYVEWSLQPPVKDVAYMVIPDVKIPWFMLGVIYTALFFLLQNKRG